MSAVTWPETLDPDDDSIIRYIKPYNICNYYPIAMLIESDTLFIYDDSSKIYWIV